MSTSAKSSGKPRGLKDVKILVVDDEVNHANATAESLERVGYDVTVATSGENGLKTLDAQRFDIVITDLVMTPVDGMDVLRKAKKRHPDCEVIVISGRGGVEQAVDSIKHGAANFLAKPLDLEVVRSQVRELSRRIIARGEGGGATKPPTGLGTTTVDDEFPEFVGRSEKLRAVLGMIRKVAPTPATVLITGSNGTGKELVARALHRLSPRAKNPFVALNCAAISENILESELFGHVRGAFTGATSNREGRFEYADGGTLFLDEIGDMSLHLQVKLLRVIQEREIVRVGANEPKQIDVRVIAATNKNLQEEIEKGNFREDLYYRLKVVHIHMPSLADRPDDISVLCDHFIEKASRDFDKTIKGLDPVALQQLTNFDWPGNVRQLENTIERMVLLAPSEMLTSADIPEDIRGTPSRSQALVPMDLFDGLSLSKIEEHMILHYLEQHDGNRAKVAKALGISERTLYRKLKEYGL